MANGVAMGASWRARYRDHAHKERHNDPDCTTDIGSISNRSNICSTVTIGAQYRIC